MKKLILLSVVAFIVGCDCDDNNNTRQTELYSSFDGCDTYKITERYQYPVYFTKCKDAKNVTTQTQVPNGKTTRSQNVQTVGEK